VELLDEGEMRRRIRVVCSTHGPDVRRTDAVIALKVFDFELAFLDLAMLHFVPFQRSMSVMAFGLL
jgi:hypothetical protein